MTSMLEPEVKPSPAREIAHQSKGCLAVLLAAAVLIFGGYFAYDQSKGLLQGFGQTADYPGPGTGAVTGVIFHACTGTNERRAMALES